MHTKATILLAIIAFYLFSAFAMTQDPQTDDEPGWGYDGELGPEYWGRLSENWALCDTGAAQSPITINTQTTADVGLVDIYFDYQTTALNLVNNGHTIQINVAAGSSITYNGIIYDLLQFHFHAPGEHRWNEQIAPMEIHFVHQDRNSANLAVVAILIHQGTVENTAYEAIFNHLPATSGEDTAPDLRVDLATLLPQNAHFYTYQGSLTTPPCSEIVRWLVQDVPIALSAEQIEAFTRLYDHNARPTQPLGNRDLLHARHPGFSGSD